jgi:ProP effector
MIKSGGENKGAVAAGAADIEKAEAIAALLVRPVGLLPKVSGDPIKPFAIGVWNDIRKLLKPETPVISLRRATSAYTHSKRYLSACAQADAYRYEIDGNPIGPVSDEDRIAAQLALSKLKNTAADTQSPSPSGSPSSSRHSSPEAAHAAPDVTRANQIRAGILGRSQRKASSI